MKGPILKSLYSSMLHSNLWRTCIQLFMINSESAPRPPSPPPNHNIESETLSLTEWREEECWYVWRMTRQFAGIVSIFLQTIL